jgi:hypothetical protein
MEVVSVGADGHMGRGVMKSADRRFLAISSGSKYIELAGDEVDHRL